MQRRRFQSAHFLLLAPPVDEVPTLLRELEGAYRHVKSLGLSLPSRIAAESFGSSAEFQRASGVGRIYLAAAIGEKIYLQPPRLLLRQEGVTRALRHELVHVALARAGRNGMPRWFSEGLAMKIAGESYPGGEKLADLAAVERCLGEGGTHRGVRECYAAARRLVDLLVRQAGEKRVLSLAVRVASGNSFAGAFSETLGMTVAEWERTHVRRK